MRGCDTQEARTPTAKGRRLVSQTLYSAYGHSSCFCRSPACDGLATKRHAPGYIFSRTPAHDRSSWNKRPRLGCTNANGARRPSSPMVCIRISSYSPNGPVSADAKHTGQTTFLSVWSTNICHASVSTSCIRPNHQRLQSGVEARSFTPRDGETIPTLHQSGFTTTNLSATTPPSSRDSLPTLRRSPK